MATTRTLKLNDSNKPTLQLTAKKLPTVEITPILYKDPRLINKRNLASKYTIPAIGRANTA